MKAEPKVSSRIKPDFQLANCKIHNGLCLAHGFSVSQEVKCPKSTLADDQWKLWYWNALQSMKENFDMDIQI